MTFLQPWLLWGLPVILLPVVIHLLNRLRYRSVKWAALMFLAAATRSSTQSARLRHYLLMACRMLILLLIVLAVSRPLVGGWLGMAAGGAPDTVVLLLDRSASMEAIAPNSAESKRVQALHLLSRFLRERGRAGHFVLIENALRTPLELQNPSALDSLALTSATDTEADLPAMLRAAIDYIIKNKTGRTEIWVASDFQESNWRPDDQEWQTLRAQLAGMAQEVKVFLLGFAADDANNRSLALHSLTCRRHADRAQLSLALDIRAATPSRDLFPLTILLNNVRSQVDVNMKATTFRYTGKLALADGTAAGGWGKAEIPADANGRDNGCYFVYGAQPAGRIVVVAENLAAAGILRAAAAPGAASTNISCEVVAPTEVGRLRWQDLALLIWQAAAPDEAYLPVLQKFVEDGGTVLCLPPGRSDKAGPFGLNWGRVEAAVENKPFRVASWEENDGPLARTENGDNLPLSGLAVTIRQLFQDKRQNGESVQTNTASWTELATYADGAAFLQSRQIGHGHLFVCSTLPHSEWSSLNHGTVLVPMMQRLIQSGSERLGQVQTAVCGAWQPAFAQDLWTSVDTSEPKDFRWQAGVYQCGSRRVALNRPESESFPEFVDKERVRQLFGEARLHFMEEGVMRDVKQAKSELWYVLVCLALAAMLLETLLLSDVVTAWRRLLGRRAAEGSESA